jgi:hypothetical protein
MTVPVPVPDGTTPPKAVLAAAVQDALDAIGCELTTSDCRVAAAAVVAALDLPTRDRETAAKALDDLADALTWKRPASCPCDNPEACCGSAESCDAMKPSVKMTGAASIRARASALREGRGS